MKKVKAAMPDDLAARSEGPVPGFKKMKKNHLKKAKKMAKAKK